VDHQVLFGQKTQNTDVATVGNDRRAPGRRNATTVGTRGPGGDDAVRVRPADRGRGTLRSLKLRRVRHVQPAAQEVGCREQP
jgi:hypothetical protein